MPTGCWFTSYEEALFTSETERFFQLILKEEHTKSRNLPE